MFNRLETASKNIKQKIFGNQENTENSQYKNFETPFNHNILASRAAGKI